MPLNAGQSLSFYEILGPLGAGGMGEVYLALDTRLQREVAIKVLPEEMADDEERLRRLEREAKTLASLNHPNVAGIHGVDQEGDLCFLALELVPGEDLATRLARGSLPVEETIDVCRQIAEGLEAAHEAGVVHRDLKPANVRITPEGVVKVLDFGLAKPMHPQTNRHGTSTAQSDSFLVTEEGLILGTPTYMSPEQARGKPVDRRTDIWAFGCVLYECLSGKRAFAGESFTDVLAAIVGEDADWSLLPELPAHVEDLLRRCLTRDPRARLRDIGEARVQLGREVVSVPTTAPPPRRGVAPILVPALAVGALLGAGLVWGGLARQRPEAPPSRPAVKLTIPSSNDVYSRLAWPVLSPDGTKVVFGAERREDDTRMLWLRTLDSFEARGLAGTENANLWFWSPDSSAIGFIDGLDLKVLRLDDAVPQTLVVGRSVKGAWSSSGRIVFAEAEGGLWVVSETGGEPEQLTEVNRELGEWQHNRPHFLPDGDRFLFLAPVRSTADHPGRHRLYAGKLSTRSTSFLTELPSDAWYTERGELLFTDEGQIRSVPFDVEELRVTGKPRTIADGVSYFQPLGRGALSASRSGDLAFNGPTEDGELMWLDRRGFELGRVGDPGRYDGHRISPDGRSLAVAVSDPRTGLTDVWVWGLGRETLRRVTSLPAWEGAPIWSPDGRTLYYSTDARGYPDIEKIELDSPGEPTRVWDMDGAQFAQHVAPDGKLLLARSEGDTWIVPLDGDGQPQRQAKLSQMRAAGSRFSPDQRWISFSSTTSGKRQVYITELEGAHRTIQITIAGGKIPVWDPGGGRLYYQVGENQLWEVDLATEKQLAEPSPRILFQTGRAFEDVEVAPDGERFLVRFVSAENSPVFIMLRGEE